MNVRLNVVKTCVTPQLHKSSGVKSLSGKAMLSDSKVALRKLKDFGYPGPIHTEDPKNEDYMAKKTIGGMAAGAGVGAGIGSFIPIVGTAIGGMVGSVVGALVGATVGCFTDPKDDKE